MIDAVVLDEIVHVVAKQLEVAPSQVTPHARFVEDLGADEVKLTVLFLALEETFDVSLSDDARDLATLVRRIEALLSR